MISRRTLLKATALTSLAPTLSLTAKGASSDATSISRRPDPALFQNGDFVWPKNPADYVPYVARPEPQGPDQDALDEALWETERKEYLRSLSGQNKLDPLDEERGSLLKQMTFHEFLDRYQSDRQRGEAAETQLRKLSVGHVGVLELDAKHQPWVIEAVWKVGVRRIAYGHWIEQRKDDWVWLGRLSDRSAEDRDKISAEAAKYLGRPYKFFDFNLNDDSGFYCSKLVWLSIYRSLNKFAVDGNDDPRRLFWFSPKQLLFAKAVQHVFEPGPYRMSAPK